MPIFDLLQRHGKIEEREMYHVFNMGIGMTVFVEKKKTEAVLKFLRQQKQPAFVIGEVTRGTGVVTLA